MPTQDQTIQKQTEIALLQRLAAKDSYALGELYDCYSRLVFAILFHILKDEEEAGHLLVKVFLRVWEEEGSFDATFGPPSVWVSGIARNLAIDTLRSRVSRTREKNDGPDGHFQPQDATDARDQEQVQSPHRREVADALAVLPIEQRELIELAYFQGYTQSELSGHFGIPVDTVSVRVRNGMSALRTRLRHLV